MSEYESTPAAAGSEQPSEPTSAYTHPLPTVPPAGPTTPPPPMYGVPATVPAKKSRRGLGGAVTVAASILLGAGAGYGGAALYNADSSEDAGFYAPLSSIKGTPTSTAPAGSVQAVAAAVLPSVVKIEVAGAKEAASGSGIILSSDGVILTNNHVVEVAGDGGDLRVDFNDGTSADAKVLGTDPLTDTAVIKVDKTGLKPATIGSSGALAVGQQVVAIGSPFGLDSTVTSGIVSALDRPVNVGSDGDGNATVYPAIQTDAAINPGNSGGALVNLAGEVVGINASIRTAGTSAGEESGSIGLGFAIPIDEVRPIIDEMAKGQTPTHARLGITVKDVGASSTGPSDEQDGPSGQPDPFGQTPGQPQQPQPDKSVFSSPGAEVVKVNPGSAAEKAGLASGDVIMQVNQTHIFGSDSLVATIRSFRPGDKVTVLFTRGGKEHTVTLELDSDATATKS